MYSVTGPVQILLISKLVPDRLCRIVLRVEDVNPFSFGEPRSKAAVPAHIAIVGIALVQYSRHIYVLGESWSFPRLGLRRITTPS